MQNTGGSGGPNRRASSFKNRVPHPRALAPPPLRLCCQVRRWSRSSLPLPRCAPPTSASPLPARPGHTPEPRQDVLGISHKAGVFFNGFVNGSDKDPCLDFLQGFKKTPLECGQNDGRFVRVPSLTSTGYCVQRESSFTVGNWWNRASPPPPPAPGCVSGFHRIFCHHRQTWTSVD